MAAVLLAWESQSTRRVGWPAAARQAERLTAVVVFPTPPFWLAIAMIRATKPSLPDTSENLAKPGSRMQDVSRGTIRSSGKLGPGTPGGIDGGPVRTSLFHVEQ